MPCETFKFLLFRFILIKFPFRPPLSLIFPPPNPLVKQFESGRRRYTEGRRLLTPFSLVDSLLDSVIHQLKN